MMDSKTLSTFDILMNVESFGWIGVDTRHEGSRGVCSTSYEGEVEGTEERAYFGEGWTMREGLFDRGRGTTRDGSIA